MCLKCQNQETVKICFSVAHVRTGKSGLEFCKLREKRETLPAKKKYESYKYVFNVKLTIEVILSRNVSFLLAFVVYFLFYFCGKERFMIYLKLIIIKFRNNVIKMGYSVVESRGEQQNKTYTCILDQACRSSIHFMRVCFSILFFLI